MSCRQAPSRLNMISARPYLNISNAFFGPTLLKMYYVCWHKPQGISILKPLKMLKKNLQIDFTSQYTVIKDR
jgi:hypothetical protein